jgi:hypothetical protein
VRHRPAAMRARHLLLLALLLSSGVLARVSAIAGARAGPGPAAARSEQRAIFASHAPRRRPRPDRPKTTRPPDRATRTTGGGRGGDPGRRRSAARARARRAGAAPLRGRRARPPALHARSRGVALAAAARRGRPRQCWRAVQPPTPATSLRPPLAARPSSAAEEEPAVEEPPPPPPKAKAPSVISVAGAEAQVISPTGKKLSSSSADFGGKLLKATALDQGHSIEVGAVASGSRGGVGKVGGVAAAQVGLGRLMIWGQPPPPADRVHPSPPPPWPGHVHAQARQHRLQAAAGHGHAGARGPQPPGGVRCRQGAQGRQPHRDAVAGRRGEAARHRGARGRRVARSAGGVARQRRQMHACMQLHAYRRGQP